MLDGLTYKKNLVPERQRVYQNSHNPIYYRLPRSRLYLGLYKSGFALGVVGIFYSAYSLVKVGDSCTAMSLHSTESVAPIIGEALSGIIVALEFARLTTNECIIIFELWLDFSKNIGNARVSALVGPLLLVSQFGYAYVQLNTMSDSQYINQRTAARSYRPGGYMSAGLTRAREPYRVKNALTGLAIGSFIVGVWLYSMSAVKQDNFDDVDEEARAMVRAGVKTLEDKGVEATMARKEKAQGLLAVLDEQFPGFLDPERKTMVWGAPPVDSVGRIGHGGCRSAQG